MATNNKPPQTLSISGLRYQYPDSKWNLAVDDFSLSEGEITAIIGPNGSGKSTLLRLAAGVQPLSTGTIHIGQNDLKKMDRRSIARVLGYLPQSTPYEFDHRVINVVSMGRYAHLSLSGFLCEEDMNIVKQCLEQTDALSLMNRRLSHLSGGERQRVLLASVLAQEPAILLLDEPTSALDLHHQVNFFDILTRLVKGGLSVAVVMHDLNLASLYCERIVLMNHGRIVCDGTPDDVFQYDLLQDVYGGDIVLSKHPQVNRPVVFPRFEREN